MSEAREDKLGITEELRALRRDIETLPPAENEEQRKALEALSALTETLERLSKRVNAGAEQAE